MQTLRIQYLKPYHGKEAGNVDDVLPHLARLYVSQGIAKMVQKEKPPAQRAQAEDEGLSTRPEDTAKDAKKAQRTKGEI